MIASETVEALSYLLSSISTPIIHRDVKSTKILLGDNFTPKVSNFRAWRLVPLDQTQLTTLVQGTLIWILDHKYLHSNQLTGKSDIYNCTILLVELLIGEEKRVICFDRPKKGRNLATLFL